MSIPLPDPLQRIIQTLQPRRVEATLHFDGGHVVHVTYERPAA